MKAPATRKAQAQPLPPPKPSPGRPAQADPPGRDVPAEYAAIVKWYASRRKLFNIVAIADGTKLSHTMVKEILTGTRQRAFAYQLDRLYAYFRAQFQDPAPAGWKPPKPEAPPSAESAE